MAVCRRQTVCSYLQKPSSRNPVSLLVPPDIVGCNSFLPGCLNLTDTQQLYPSPKAALSAGKLL